MPASLAVSRVRKIALVMTASWTLAANGASASPATVSGKLVEAGAACGRRIDSIAQGALKASKTISSESVWRITDPAKHMVSVIVGQNFGEGSNVPHGVTGIVAAPGPPGARCDGYTFQVLPSWLSCEAIERGMEGGKAVDLGGLPLIRLPGRQFILMPTADAKGCVVVAFHTEY